MRGRWWPRSPCPCIPGGTGWTNATRNVPGTLDPAAMEVDAQTASDPSSPVSRGYLPLTPATPPHIARGTLQPDSAPQRPPREAQAVFILVHCSGKL